MNILLCSFHSYAEFTEPLLPEWIMRVVIFSFFALLATSADQIFSTALPVSHQQPHATHTEFHSHRPDLQLPHLSTWPSSSHSTYQRRDTQAGQYNPGRGDMRTVRGEAPILSFSGIAEFCVVSWKGPTWVKAWSVAIHLMTSDLFLHP